MKKTLTWLATLGLIASALFYPVMSGVVQAYAWILIVAVFVFSPLCVIGYIVLDNDKRMAEHIARSAKNHRKLGFFAWLRILTVTGALAYTELPVTAVFWFIAALLAWLPGFVASEQVKK